MSLSIEIITLITTVTLALLGYLITYANNLRISKRKEQLDLVNKRISEFYGPLYVATQTGKKEYEALLKFLNKKAVFDDPDGPPTKNDLKEWRIWLKTVFMPNNEFIEKLILEKAYLIQEQDMPDCLLDYITHISGYKAITEKWNQKIFLENRSIIDFPQELQNYASESYKQLKAKQLKLIGKSK